jgi:hypothetical protein
MALIPITMTQAQVDAAVEYLMTGGPGGGELTPEQYNDRSLVWRFPAGGSDPNQPDLSDFMIQLQLAVLQGHSGISNSRNLLRDEWGTIVTAQYAVRGGGTLASLGAPRFAISISG